MNREIVRRNEKEDMGMRKISAQMVPRILIHDKKQRRLHILSDLCRNAEMFDKVIIGDETWFLKYDPETKRQSGKHTIHLGRKKTHMPGLQVKKMLVCFFDHKEIVHNRFTAPGQTVNQQCYLELLKRLRESVRRKRPELWSDKWILHHDNALGHDILRVREFLAKNSITKKDHPPYSPDLAPAIFGSFQNEKCPQGTNIR